MAGSFLILVTFALAVCVIQQAQAMAYIQKALNFDNCGGSNNVFQVQQFDVSPYPPRYGDTVTLKATVNSKKTVTGGKVEVSVQGRGNLKKLNINKQYDLCSVIPTSCPIKQGPITIDIARKLPTTPFRLTGIFDVKVVATSNQGEQLLCAKLPVEID